MKFVPILVLALAAAVVGPLRAADDRVVKRWPSWRGADFSGSVAAGDYASAWGESDKILWKTKLPGKGCSTPIVWDDQILLTAPVNGEDAVVALNWSGKQVWATPLGKERGGQHRNGSGCNPSLATNGQRLFAYFKSGTLAGLDMHGKLLWSTNLQKRFGKDTLYWDLGTSPVLTDSLVIVAVMHGGESYLAAFDQRTGDLKWKAARNYQTPTEGDHSYATPRMIQHQGRPALLVWGAEHLTAHAIDDGRVLWSCGDFNPQRTGNWVVVSSAVVAGDMAIVPFGRGSRLAGVRLGGEGDVTATHRAWTRADTGVFVPSPIVYEGRVYLVRDEGEVECLDPATGQTVWKDRLPKNRNKYYASPTIAGGKLYAPREDGVVFVADIREKFSLLSENDMGERIIAAPVPVAGRLLIRGEEHLYCIGR